MVDGAHDDNRCKFACPFEHDPRWRDRLEKLDELAIRMEERWMRVEEEIPKMQDAIKTLEKSQAKWAGAIAVLAFLGSIFGSALMRMLAQ